MKTAIRFSAGIIGLLCLLSANGYADPITYRQAKEVYARGEMAFTQGRHANAFAFFKQVESFLADNPTYKTGFDHRKRGLVLSEAVTQHQKLGEFTPDVVHRVLVFYVKRTDAALGKQRIVAEFSNELKEKAEVAQQVCARYVELLSAGALTLEFDAHDLDATLTEVTSSISDYTGTESVQASLESLLPYPTKLLYEHIGEFDSLLLYWNDGGLRLENGGGGKALGGSVNIPLIPYLLEGPKRGRLFVSSSLLHRPGTLLHEFFHTMEDCYGIQQRHGFMDRHRQAFPQWQGIGEFDYYRNHFEQTFAPRSYKGASLHTTNPNLISPGTLALNLSKIQNLGDDESAFQRLREAEALYIQGWELDLRDQNDQAAEFYQRTVELNPFHSKALLRLGKYYHYQDEKKRAFAQILQAYEANPDDPEIYYWMGIEYFHQNQIPQSIRCLSEGLALDPGSARLYHYRGFVHFVRRHYPEAESDFRSCLAISSQYAKWIKTYLATQRDRGNTAAGKMLEQLGLATGK